MEQFLNEVIEGCRRVKENPEIHKDAKDLANCVIRDCKRFLDKLHSFKVLEGTSDDK